MLGFNVFTPPTPFTTAAIKVLEEFPKFKSKYHPKFKSKYEYQKKTEKSTRVPKVLKYDRVRVNILILSVLWAEELFKVIF